MIQARLAAPRRAALVTSLVLGAALLRAVLLPVGDLFSTAVFAACLLAITWVERTGPPTPTLRKGGGRFRPPTRTLPREGGGRWWTLAVGLLVGAILVLPSVGGHLTERPLAAFWRWAAVAAVIATLEETAIRGALYRRWLEEAGPAVAIVAGAVVFALIHLPRYGLGAMPLDLAVGVALGGLRAVTGRVLPCAVAHTIADWGAWFWA